MDEIGEINLAMQSKLVRVLQEAEFERVGGNKTIKVNVRVIASTNKDLRKEVEEGNFREDLFHRLAVIILRVPSLNERKSDIPELVEHFNVQICKEYGIKPKKVDPGAIKELQSINWTGNIRELRNVVERLIILSQEKITKKDVTSFAVAVSNRRDNLQDLFDKFDSFAELKTFLEKEYEKYRAVTV